jgi:hypothetical protein
LILENDIHLIICPKAGNPRICKNTTKTITHICNKQKKKQQDCTNCKNLATNNFSDFNDAIKECIWQQVLQSMSVTLDAASISLSITSATGGTTAASAGSGRGKKPFVFICNVQVVWNKTHIQIFLLASKVECPTSLSSSALFLTKATARASDVSWTLLQLSAHGINISWLLLQSSSHTVLLRSSFLKIIHLLFSWELNRMMHGPSPLISHQFHPPYLTKDGTPTSFIAATGPQVSMNMVLGLLMIKATSMVINTALMR